MRRLRRIHALILGAASVLWADALPAQERGRVTGVVVDERTSAPLAGVHISGARRVTVTDHRGRFELCGLASGPADLVAARRGYYRMTPTVTIGASAPPPLRLAMTRDPTWRPEPADAPADSSAGIGRPRRTGVVLGGQRFIQSSDGCGATPEIPLAQLETIHPDSVANITVVRAAEAAATHGFTGVDGATIIPTKRPSPP
ncbi:MAG TPA: carboxypeptidase regulatory-like domain-containing protein [Longimicrobium sp.]|jgi:hypothetical protein|uniref:carboxypeptidase regulatory-like domain-containing protein n=1 Tax=Longimicrobium sp. TaxID=2029185 RepID=UPI002ED834B1